MKILNKSQQKEIYVNLLQQQLAAVREILAETSISFPSDEKKDLEKTILRLMNMANNYNISFDDYAEEIKCILSNPHAVSEMKKFSKSFFQNAHKYKDILQNTMQEGLRQRNDVNPSFPSCFDKQQTIYMAIDTSLSAFDVVAQNLHQINEVLPKDSQLSFNEKTHKLEDGKQHFSLGAFFSRRALGLKEFMRKNDFVTDEALEKVLQHHDFSQFIELRKQRALTNNLLNHQLIKLLSDKVLFYQTTDLLQKQHTKNFSDKLRNALSSLTETYSRADKMIDFAQKKSSVSSDSLSVDTLLISINPHLLATQSEYKNWHNCTSASDFNHHRVIDGIAQGSIIVYGINAKFPQKKICRILLTPYQNQKGDIIYYCNKNYGEYNLGFKKAVENLAQTFSSDEKGIYNINPHILPDNAPLKLLRFSSAEEFCKYQNYQYSVNENGKIFVPELNLSRYGLKMLPDFFQNIQTNNLSLAFNPLENLKNCPECQTLDISHCDQLDKNVGTQIPLTVKNLNARFSNFNGLGISKESQLEELNVSNNDALDEKFLFNLPSNVKILKANYTNLTSLYGLPKHVENVSVDGCDIKQEYEMLDLIKDKSQRC